LVALVKKILPAPFKEKVKSIKRERRFAAALRRLASVGDDETLMRDIVAELGRAWGEDGYHATGGYLEEIARWATKTQGPVLEIGSGLTTLVLATLVSRRDLDVWTLEHDLTYFRITEAKLRRHNITNVHLMHAPLRDYGDFCWYDPPLDVLPRNFALIVADGPPGDVKGGRFGLIPVLRSYFAPRVVILLDDAERVKEKAVLRKWTSEFGLSQQLHARDGKAWAICSFSDAQPDFI
jgi:hypothetical protein